MPPSSENITERDGESILQSIRISLHSLFPLPIWCWWDFFRQPRPPTSSPNTRAALLHRFCSPHDPAIRRGNICEMGIARRPRPLPSLPSRPTGGRLGCPDPENTLLILARGRRGRRTGRKAAAPRTDTVSLPLSLFSCAFVRSLFPLPLRRGEHNSNRRQLQSGRATENSVTTIA